MKKQGDGSLFDNPRLPLAKQTFIGMMIIPRKEKGSGLEMTLFFNNKQVLMENVLFQDLTPKVLIIKKVCYLLFKKGNNFKNYVVL